jgi:Ni/Fe-hydrogenase subunit HybB-like protein
MVDKEHKIIAEDAPLFEHIWKTGKGFYITVSILAALVLWGVYAYVTQYLNGLTVTGLSRQIFWGVYITNFVFFIGISHAGTFISAVLRVLKAEWRRPISRLSELTTVFILMFGVGSVLIDLEDRTRCSTPSGTLIFSLLCSGMYVYFDLPDRQLHLSLSGSHS